MERRKCSAMPGLIVAATPQSHRRTSQSRLRTLHDQTCLEINDFPA